VVVSLSCILYYVTGTQTALQVGRHVTAAFRVRQIEVNGQFCLHASPRRNGHRDRAATSPTFDMFGR
jgi:hypothetical protein